MRIEELVMPTPFIMPKFDMDQENATVLTWMKQEGDQVEYDEPVLTVETDKVAIDVPAPASGILARITAQPGDVVPVTNVIAYILQPGESLSDIPAVGTTPSPSPKATTTMNRETSTQVRKETNNPNKGDIKATPVAERMAHSLGINLADISEQPKRIKKADVEEFIQGSKVPATPSARRRADELGLDLKLVPGSGPQRRVQEKDVEQYHQQIASQSPGLATLVPSAEQTNTTRQAKLIPLTGIRRTIAERMQASFQTIPHIAFTVEVDISRFENTRAGLNELAAQLEKNSISMTTLLVRLTAWVLQKHPLLNASLIDETIYQWRDINIGVATAIPEGLIVPVIHRADQKTVSEINEQLKDLSTRARTNKITLAEVKEGTFTISNLGMFGIQQFRAIINPPESAILAVGSVIRKPVVVDHDDSVEVRPMLAMTLSTDHRIADGVAAAEFLKDLTHAIEHPEVLIY
jgi:pyruvate dehydrogenase E2 component (dihydrolipoyllysine-residue acetyltransferase)